jgi:glutaredoxin 2
MQVLNRLAFHLLRRLCVFPSVEYDNEVHPVLADIAQLPKMALLKSG